MRDIPLALLNAMPVHFEETKRYVVLSIGQWIKSNTYYDIEKWIDTPEGKEMAEWVRDNLSPNATLALLFNTDWVITTSNRDDQVLLALRYGFQ